EQDLGQRAAIGPTGEQASGERPAPLRRGRLARAASRETPPAGALRLDLVAASRAKRRPRVVRDLARPDEVPQRGQGLLRLEAGVGEQVEPEQGAAAE